MIPQEKDYNYPYTVDGKRESLKSYSYFKKFLEGDYTSLTALAHEVNISPKHLYNLSAKYNWVERREQYKQDLFLKEQEEKEKLQKELLEDLYTVGYSALRGDFELKKKAFIKAGVIPDPETGEFNPDESIKLSTLINASSNLSTAMKMDMEIALRGAGLPSNIDTTYNFIMKDCFNQLDAEVNIGDDKEDTDYNEFKAKYMRLQYTD